MIAWRGRSSKLYVRFTWGIKPLSWLLGVGGPVPCSVGLDAGIANPRSATFINEPIFCANGDGTAVFGMVEEPNCGCEVSMRVMVSPEGTLPEPLCFRLFVIGPECPLGEAGRDRLRGVRVAEVPVEGAEGTANGLLTGVMG